jgi:anti-anti-sigma regulatory factor
MVGTLIFLLNDLISGSPMALVIAVVAVVYGLLLYAYWRGWEYARYINVVMVTLSAAFAIQEPQLAQQASLAVLVVPILTLILTDPLWLLGSTLALISILLVRAGGIGVYTSLDGMAIYITGIGGLVLIRLIADSAQLVAEENARQAEEARAQAEGQARELADANELMSEQLDQQSQLLDLVTTLETPVVPLAEGMLFAPIVGHIDSRRAQMLTTRLLEQASVQRARLVVLDIGGVAVVDTAVAQSLLQAVQALRLLGCEVILSGISASVALALIHLGVNLDEVRTVRSPQDALAQYLSTHPQAPSETSSLKKQALLPIKPNRQVPNN